MLTFDAARACLQGPAGPVALRRKSFEVLHYLVDHPERVVAKDELLEAVWAGVTVGEDSLAQCITEIRRALGPTGRDVVRTVPRRGYLLSMPAPIHDTPTPHGGETHDALPLPERPSIAVLPFANLGGLPQDDYFSDGIAEDIITELSRFSELFVIARNSSFQYNGKSIDVRQIGRDLGIRYVLEGSVRRDERSVRITAQLVDAATGMHIWAERYDRGLEHALSVQDEVARQIVTVLAVHVRKAEGERVLTKPPAKWQAYDYYLRAVDCVTAYHSSYDREALFRGRRLLQQALAIDPTYARAQAALSSCYMSQWVHRWDDDCPWTEALDRSYQTARESVRLAPELPEAHVALGQALTFLRQHAAAVTAVERATALNPNLTSFRFAYTYILAGEAARAAQLLEKHMRLDPFYEPNAPTALGFAYHMLARYGEALPFLQEAVSRAPDMAHGRYVLAMTYARLGELDKAKAEVVYALRLEPWYRISQSLTAKYFKRAEDTEHLITGLRLAGFSE
ncbi:MAG TPA: winged helix-turn-helix domain-containing protein [Hyphomicrobiaceae bacterium]|nr:winged helix-turn-helix domain-containing protein [Hyphomicrobiaceae bacterium]